CVTFGLNASLSKRHKSMAHRDLTSLRNTAYLACQRGRNRHALAHGPAFGGSARLGWSRHILIVCAAPLWCSVGHQRSPATKIQSCDQVRSKESSPCQSRSTFRLNWRQAVAAHVLSELPQHLSGAQWEKELEWLDHVPDIPGLPDEALTRESIYTR